MNRFQRNEQLFGKEGQMRLKETKVAIMGTGGLGSFVATQVALLGVGKIVLIDHEELSLSNRNRYIGAWHGDPIPGSPKVELSKRHISLIDPCIEVVSVFDNIISEVGINTIKESDYVFGCVDNDGVRFVLNEACLAYNKPLIDLASDVPEEGKAGGRVAIITGNKGCLDCMDLLDKDEVRRFLSTEELVENESSVYGVESSAIAEAGPSVVSVNGVVASLGVTEFMRLVTGMIDSVPYTLLTYRSELGDLYKKNPSPTSNCYYCGIHGKGDNANIERYFPFFTA